MLARKSLLLFTVSMAGSALGFLSTVVIARWMGAAALGTVGYLLGLLGLLAVLLDLGFQFAHLKRVSDTAQDPSPLVGTFLAIKVALAVLFLICVRLLPVVRQASGVALFVSREEEYSYYILAAFYVLQSLAAVFLLTFEARLETAKETIPDFLGSVVTFVAKAAVAFSGLSIVALSAAYLVESVVRLTMSLVLFRGYRIARATQRHLVSYVRYAAPLTVNTALSMVVANLNPVILKASWGDAAVGYYTSVLGFGLVMDRVASTLMVVFFPQASSDVAQGNWGEVRRRLSVVERYMLTLLVPLGVLFVFFSTDIVVVALGIEFLPAVTILACLAVNSVGAATFQPYKMLLYATERQGDLVLSSLVGLFALLVADAVLVPTQLAGIPLAGLSGVGAALGLVAMTLASGVVQVRATTQQGRVRFYWKALLHLLAGAAMYIAMRALAGSVVLSMWLRLPLLALLGLVVYLGALALMRQFTCSDVRVFLNVLHPQRMAEYISGELDGSQ